MADGYESVVARNVAAARARLRGLTQKAAAARMKALGFEWRQQTMARVEAGSRPVTASEILGLAEALETSIGALLDPSLDDPAIELPSGRTLPVHSVLWSVRHWNDGAVVWPADDSPDIADLWSAGGYQGQREHPMGREMDSVPSPSPELMRARNERFDRANGYAEPTAPPRRQDSQDTDE